MKLLRWLGGLLALVGAGILYGMRLMKTRESTHDIKRTANRRREELREAQHKAADSGDTSGLRDQLIESIDEDD